MKPLLFAAGMSATLLLSGCATLPQAIAVVSTANSAVSYAQAAWAKVGVTLFDVEATYGVIQTAMVNFEKGDCPRASSHSYCPALHADFAGADAKVRSAFGKGEAFITAHPTLSPSTVIQAAEAAVSAIAAVADKYGVKI